MKVITYLILFLFIFSCSSMKNALDFSSFNGNTAQNSFTKMKILPGRQENTPYTLYTILINPSLDFDKIEVRDKKGGLVSAHVSRRVDQENSIEISFSDLKQTIDENNLYLSFTLEGKDFSILLPKPQDTGVLNMP